MKPTLFILICLACLCVLAQQPSPATGTVTLGWSASATTDQGPLSYYVFVGTNSGVYFTNYPVGTNLTCTVSNLVRGQSYFFAATCSETNSLTSVYSNETNCVLPTSPYPPYIITLTIH